MTRRARSAVALLLAMLAWPAVAGAGTLDRQGSFVASGPAAQFYGYSTPVMVVERGGELDYANFDIVQHDVVQDVRADGFANKKRKDPWCKDFKKRECPLFWSPRASLGEQVQVQGLKNVKSGQVYTFFCTLHPGMKGHLVVAP